jgi:cytochrome oxidase Cu insertion factor (SCO1/SenC/PrrC family)
MNRTAIFLIMMFSFFNLQAHNLTPVDSADSDANESAGRVDFTANFPDIELVDQRNQSVELKTLFGEQKNVVFAFFFSHCISVCTTITQSLKSLQPDLPPGTLIAMISIDPDNDTPDLLADYAKQHRIDAANWYLLTGNNDQIVALQKDFEAYRGNKMNHTTSLFVKKPNSEVITEFKRNFSAIPGFLETSLTGV